MDSRPDTLAFDVGRLDLFHRFAVLTRLALLYHGRRPQSHSEFSLPLEHLLPFSERGAEVQQAGVVAGGDPLAAQKASPIGELK